MGWLIFCCAAMLCLWWWSAANKNRLANLKRQNDIDAKTRENEYLPRMAGSAAQQTSRSIFNRASKKVERSPHIDYVEYDVFIDKRYRDFVRDLWDKPGVDASGITISRVSGGYAQPIQLKAIVKDGAGIYITGWVHGEPKAFAADDRAGWTRDGKAFSSEAFSDAIDGDNANLALSPSKRPASVGVIKANTSTSEISRTKLTDNLTFVASSSVSLHEPDKYKFDGEAREEWLITYDELNGSRSQSPIYIAKWKDKDNFTYYDCWFFLQDRRRVLRSDRIIDSRNLDTNRMVKNIRSYLTR